MPQARRSKFSTKPLDEDSSVVVVYLRMPTKLCFALAYSSLTLMLASAQDAENVRAAAADEVEILNTLADGTPPPPKPSRTAVPAPATKQQSQQHDLGDRTATFTRVKPSEVVPIPEPDRSPSEAPRELTPAELEDLEALWAKQTFLSLSATVYDREVSLLGWRHEGKRYRCWSNIDAFFLGGVSDFKVRDHTYSLFMGIGAEHRERKHLDAADHPPTMPSWPPQFEMIGEEPDDQAALAPIIALHELYAVKHDRLARAYEGRERAYQKHLAWLEENPPKPPNSAFYHWPTKGGDIRDELPPITTGIRGGGQPLQRFGQARLPQHASERAVLQAEAERVTRLLEQYDKQPD